MNGEHFRFGDNPVEWRSSLREGRIINEIIVIELGELEQYRRINSEDVASED